MAVENLAAPFYNNMFFTPGTGFLFPAILQPPRYLATWPTSASSAETALATRRCKNKHVGNLTTREQHEQTA